MKISVYNKQKDLKIAATSVKRTIESALAFHNTPCDELAIHFISNKAMCKLHADFFNDPSPTDCVSFPYDSDRSSGYFFLGEVFVCPKTALKYVEEKGGDIYQETTLYLIHGLLHLLGYDDIESKDRKIIRSKEKELMTHLSLENNILSASIAD